MVLQYLNLIRFFHRITGDLQKVEYAKQLVYELIAEKEMQMFHRGGRTTERPGNYSSDNGFNHGSTNTDGVEVNNHNFFFPLIISFIFFTNYIY